MQVTVGSNARRSAEFELGGVTKDGGDWFGTGQFFKEKGWREDSPSKVGQLFGKLGWRDGATRVSLSLAHAESGLNGNGLQEQQLLASDWRSVYTKPDENHSRSDGATLQVQHDLSRTLAFSGNAYVRYLRTDTLNGDIN